MFLEGNDRQLATVAGHIVLTPLCDKLYSNCVLSIIVDVTINNKQYNKL